MSRLQTCHQLRQLHASPSSHDLWKTLFSTRKKAAWRPLFPRPCGQLFGLRPTSFLFNLRHGRLGGCALPPTKVFPWVIKVIGTLENRNCSSEESWSSERLALDPRRTGRVLERSLGVQDDHMDARNDFSFHVPIRKCLLTHQDSTCPPSLELDPWRTGWVPDRSLHFNVSNNPTLLNYLKQLNFVHLVARKWTLIKVWRITTTIIIITITTELRSKI